MTRLKAMDTSGYMFTVAVVGGQLAISMPVDAIGDDSFGSWYSENEDKLDRVVSVTIEHNEIESSEVKQQVKQQVKQSS